MVWALLLLCALVVVGQALGLRTRGGEPFAPITVLCAAALIGVGSLLAAWITTRGFSAVAEDPDPNQQASLAGVAGFLIAAQEAGLIVAVAAGLMAAIGLVAGRPRAERTYPREGPSWHWMLLDLFAARPN
jgi:hypothetical protein